MPELSRFLRDSLVVRLRRTVTYVVASTTPLYFNEPAGTFNDQNIVILMVSMNSLGKKLSFRHAHSLR